MMFKSNKLSDKKKRLFFSQLQVLLKAGLSFTSSFSLIIEGASGHDAEVYRRMFDRVIAGASLWAALKEEDDFSRLDFGVIRIGEESGKLIDALGFLTDYYEKKESQRRTLVSALSYPMITLGVAVVVLVFMMLVVIPMFEQVYARMGGELPAMTRMMISISNKMPAIFLVAVILAGVWYVVKRVYGNTDLFQKMTSSLLLKLPYVGNLICLFQVSRLSRLLYLLISSDVPILQSLRLISEIIRFYPVRRSLLETCDIVEHGGLLHTGFDAYPSIYSRKFTVLLRVGEETNSLDAMLKTLSDDMSAELDYEIKQVNNALEPALILLIGIIVAFVLISMYLPMFKMGMTIQ